MLNGQGIPLLVSVWIRQCPGASGLDKLVGAPTTLDEISSTWHPSYTQIIVPHPTRIPSHIKSGHLKTLHENNRESHFNVVTT